MRLAFSHLLFPLVALAGLALATLACGLGSTSGSDQRAWTPAPGAQPTARPGEILPRASDSPWSVATLPPTQPTATRGAALPTPSRTPAPTSAVGKAAAAPTPTPAPTPDPNLVVISEADITQAVSSGATAASGLTVEGLAVRFADGKLRLTASKLAFGVIQVQNLTLVGRLVAQGGALQLQTESVSPQGLVTALLPSVANQALAQFAAQWYVEEVRTLDGRIELRIR